MRTTIDIPDPLHRIAMGLAHHTGRTFSQTLVDLIERGLSAPAGTAETGPPARQAWVESPLTGLPTTRSRRVVTPQDVAELEDEA